MNFWKKISALGINDQMPSLTQRRIRLSNQLSIILAFFILIIIALLTLKLQLYTNAIVLVALFLFVISIPFLNKIGYNLGSRLLLSAIIPIAVVMASTYGKLNSETGKDIVFYFAPRLFIIASLVIPLILIDYRDRFYFYFSLAIYFISLVAYSKIQSLAGVGIENANLNTETYFLATSISVLAFLVLTVSFVFLQRTNVQYEKSLIEKNQLLQEQKNRISNAYEEIQAAEEELRQNTEELFALNENLSEANSLVLEKNQALELSNKAISQQAQMIESSIRYAKNIQNATLPSLENLDKFFKNFVIYRPRDIVSGDFIWHHQLERENEMLVSAVDCTGHGVPGAFMSIISSRILTKIVSEYKITDPATILEKLNLSIIEALKQDQTNNLDGLDICLCKISNEAEKINVDFSGAKLPVFHFNKSKNEIIRIKGDSKHIGGVISEVNRNKKFTTKKIELQKGDMLYLASDGYIDQHNVDRKRFGTKRLSEKLLEIAPKDISEQKKILEQNLDLWKQKCNQRDDITLLGIKF